MKYLEFICFYIYLQYAGLKAIIQFLFTNKRGAGVYTNTMINHFNIKFMQKKISNPICKEKCFFLINHCSWADFFIDSHLTNYATYLSRNLVLLGILLPGIYGYISGSIQFFHRGKNMYDVVKSKILKNMNESVNKQFIIYPEGTRNKTNALKELKTGCISMAYQENIPCQILIATNKNEIINEKKLNIKKNITSEVMISKVIYPKDFSSSEKFVEFIKEEWVKTWELSYDKSIDSIPYKIDPIMKTKGEIKFNNKKIYYCHIVLIAIMYTLFRYLNVLAYF